MTAKDLNTNEIERGGEKMETLDGLYNEILTKGPSPGTLFLILTKLKEDGHLKRVIQECLKALNVYPFDIEIRKLLAESYFEAGLISQAEAELVKVASQIGDLIPSYKLQAEIYNQQGRDEEAVEALNIFLAHQPDDQEALDLLNSLRPLEETPVEESVPEMKDSPGPLEEIIEHEITPPEEEGLPEIATPTLAEIYFDQGQVQNAIGTYEKVIAKNPEDEHSRQRLEELRSMLVEEEVLEDKEVDKVRQKKEKIIGILESWLANIQEKSKTPLSVT